MTSLQLFSSPSSAPLCSLFSDAGKSAAIVRHFWARRENVLPIALRSRDAESSRTVNSGPCRGSSCVCSSPPLPSWWLLQRTLHPVQESESRWKLSYSSQGWLLDLVANHSIVFIVTFSDMLANIKQPALEKAKIPDLQHLLISWCKYSPVADFKLMRV